jgi:hypothetical protein
MTYARHGSTPTPSCEAPEGARHPGGTAAHATSDELPPSTSRPPTTSSDPLVRLESRPARGAAVLAALCFVALLPTLLSPFFGDDYFHIEHAADLRDALTKGWVLPIDKVGAWWTEPGLSVEYFRPLVVLSFAADRALYGRFAGGYHLTNLLLHVATTLLLWRIARHVLGRGFAAWAAAALFAIHPAHTVAIGWISGRTDVLATVFYAAAFLLYLQWRARAGSPLRLALACVGFALALLAKEMAITLPAVVLAHALLTSRAGADEATGAERGAESLPRRLFAPLVLGVVALAYLAVRVKVLGGLHAPPVPFAYHLGDAGLVLHLLTAPLLYLADLVIFVPPDPMATLPFWTSHLLLLAAFLAIVLFIFAGTMKKAPTRALALWGLAWMGITVLPVLMLTMGEHFLYLPSLGYCVLVASQLPASPDAIDRKQRRSLAVVGALVALVCFGRTAMFTWFSRDGAAAIEQAGAAIDRAPRATRVLVADLPASAALAFPDAVRLAHPDRQLDVEILSLVPRVMPDADDLSTVAFDAPDRLTLRRPSGYLGSYLERALQGPPVAFRPGDTVQRPGYSVTVIEAGAPPGRLRAFEVKLSEPVETLVLTRARGGQSPGAEGNLVPLAPISPQ